MKVIKGFFKCVVLVFFIVSISNAYAEGDVHIPGYTQKSLAKVLSPFQLVASRLKARYTVINYDYDVLLKRSQADVKRMLKIVNQVPTTDPDYLSKLVRSMALYFDQHPTPYSTAAAQGEGNWYGTQMLKRGAPHIKQDLVYRTDYLDCNTMVQLVMGLIGSHDLSQFQRHMVDIDYGAESLVNAKINRRQITYANRNNFFSADFNPANERIHRIENVTSIGPFSGHTKLTSAMIDHYKWFALQGSPNRIQDTVRVLSANNGPAMADRLQNNYASDFPTQKVSIDYIPKAYLIDAHHFPDGHTNYMPNEARINVIPVPSVLEIVRDVNQWMVGGRPISDVIGSGINISHVALLYRGHFKYHDAIYQKISCDYNKDHEKICQVNQVNCQNAKGCAKTMMLAATNAYPNGYLWSYNSASHAYACTAADKVPEEYKPLTTCNRVLSMPLGDYLTTYSYGKYAYMDNASIVGIHIEKLLRKL